MTIFAKIFFAKTSFSGIIQTYFLQVLYKKVVLKSFEIFTTKYLSWSFSVIKACIIIKERLQHRCCPVNIAKLLRTPILKNICKRLLLTFNNLSWISKTGENRVEKRKETMHNKVIKGIFRSYQTSVIELFCKNC